MRGGMGGEEEGSGAAAQLDGGGGGVLQGAAGPAARPTGIASREQTIPSMPHLRGFCSRAPLGPRGSWQQAGRPSRGPAAAQRAWRTEGRTAARGATRLLMKPDVALWGQRCPQTLVTSPHAFGPRQSLGWPATSSIMLFKAVFRSCSPNNPSLRVPLGMANCVTTVVSPSKINLPANSNCQFY